MKKIIVTGFALLMAGTLFAPAFAQEAQPAPVQASPAAPDAAAVTPAAPVKKKAGKKKTVKKAAPKAAAEAVSQEPAPAVAAAPEVPQVPQTEAALAVPAVVSEAIKPEAARRSVCPNCFQPLLAGYNEIIVDLKPWMEDMDVKAGALAQNLSDIQKKINGKDDEIERAKLGPDKKAAKETVKNLNKERKTFLKEYSNASDEKDKFYKKFSKEAEKKIEGYNKIVESKKQMTLSAASSQ